MSKELLIELQKECIELGMAGSNLGICNIRLQKLFPKFEKLGQKIKPFKMIAERINTLLNSKEDESEDNLISLLNLVNAILSIQAETDIEGEIEVAHGTSGDMNANVSSHLILPVARALTTTGGGRYNVIEEAVKDEVFSDFRLIPLLIKGLDDKYGEIGQLIYDKLKDMNNSEFLPLLQESFDRQGKRGDAFRLSLIAQIIGEDVKEFCIDLLEDSSKDIKVEAVNILGNLNDTENILLEQVKSKTKDVRKAAYCGLVKINSEEGRKELEKAIKKTDYDIVLLAIGCSNEENYADILLAGLKDTYDKLIKKQNEKGIQKIIEILTKIKSYKSEEVFEFLVQCLKEEKMFEWKATYYVSAERVLVQCIAEYEDIPYEVIELIENRKDSDNNRIFDIAFDVSLRNRTSEEVYEIYNTYFINKKLNEEMLNKAMNTFSGYLGYKQTGWCVGRNYWYRSIPQEDIEIMLQPIHKEFDKRWIEIFKSYKNYSLLAYTLDKEDTSTIEFMIKKMEKYNKLTDKHSGNFRTHLYDLIDIITGLLKIGYDGVYEIILNKVKATTGYNFRCDEMLWFISYLPSNYIGEIKKFVEELKTKGAPVDNAYIEMRIKNIEEALAHLEKN